MRYANILIYSFMLLAVLSVSAHAINVTQSGVTTTIPQVYNNLQSGGNGAEINQFATGASAMIETVSQPAIISSPQGSSSAQVSASSWVGITLTNGAFLQAGYEINSQSGTYPASCTPQGCTGNVFLTAGKPTWFWEYFPASSPTAPFYGGLGQDGSAGPDGTYNTYSFTSSGNVWTVYLNNQQIGTVNLGASSAPYRNIQGIVEVQGTKDNSAYLSPVTFKSLDYYNGQSFIPLDIGNAYVGHSITDTGQLPNMYGVQGSSQDGTNQFTVGSGLPAQQGASLWTQISGQPSSPTPPSTPPPGSSAGATPGSGSGNQQGTTPPTSSLEGALCTGPNGGIIPQYSIFGANIGPEQQLLAIAGSILAVMFAVVGILYMIGRSFGLGRMVQTARTELGEIFVTVLVVIIFVGSFSLASTATHTNSLFSAPVGGANNNIFVADCSALLTTVQNNLVIPYWVLNIDNQALGLAQSLNVNVFVNGWGFSISPFAGLSVIQTVLSTMMGITSAFILMMIGVSVLLGLLYTLMPLFLYVGIVLRSMPWTRAAGGAFIGMFAALYIMFPFLMYSMLSIYPQGSQPIICPPTGCQIGSLLNGVESSASLGTPITSAAFAGITGFFQNLGYGMITGFISAVVDPVLYTIFAVAISLFISFDFMEGMGDLLGAPALEAGNVLRKVV